MNLRSNDPIFLASLNVVTQRVSDYRVEDLPHIESGHVESGERKKFDG